MGMFKKLIPATQCNNRHRNIFIHTHLYIYISIPASQWERSRKSPCPPPSYPHLPTPQQSAAWNSLPHQLATGWMRDLVPHQRGSASNPPTVSVA